MALAVNVPTIVNTKFTTAFEWLFMLYGLITELFTTPQAQLRAYG